MRVHASQNPVVCASSEMQRCTVAILFFFVQLFCMYILMYIFPYINHREFYACEQLNMIGRGTHRASRVSIQCQLIAVEGNSFFFGGVATGRLSSLRKQNNEDLYLHNSQIRLFLISL